MLFWIAEPSAALPDRCLPSLQHSYTAFRSWFFRLLP